LSRTQPAKKISNNSFPAVLEIIETPASPAGGAIALIIIGFLVK
jgi:hypothetical protein